MTPQSSFMVLAPIERVQIAPLRDLLTTMNSAPGTADPNNQLVPFGRFEQIHFARFVVLDDQTTGDLKMLYGIDQPEPPVYLAFLGEVDGGYDSFIRSITDDANSAAGLRRIFSFCQGFQASTNLRQWMIKQEARPAAGYINWVGRTVIQTREEEALRVALRDCLLRSANLVAKPARQIHQELRRFVQQEQSDGKLRLTPAAPTPLGWLLRHIFDWALLVGLLVFGTILGILTLPLTIIPILLFLWRLRVHEKSDRVFAPRPTAAWEAKLSAIEDFDVTNQFSVMGSLKPGLLRASITRLVLFAIDLTARTIFTKGRLARVHTIHSARWVYVGGRDRLSFFSNYDGSLDSYMDDFINKVSFGLNVIFSNGVTYPHTDWLLFHGAKDEQTFKHVLRRHQLPTEVWYNAHAGLSASDLQRNSILREGLEKSAMTESEAEQWVALL